MQWLCFQGLIGLPLIHELTSQEKYICKKFINSIVYIQANPHKLLRNSLFTKIYPIKQNLIGCTTYIYSHLPHIWNFNTYNKPRVDLLQNLLFVQSHPFSIAFLDSLLFQFLTSVHFSRRSHLTCTDFPKPSLPKYPVHSKCVFCDWLTAKKQKQMVFQIQNSCKYILLGTLSIHVLYLEFLMICDFYPSWVFSMPISLGILGDRKHTMSLKVYSPYLVIKL